MLRILVARLLLDMWKSWKEMRTTKEWEVAALEVRTALRMVIDNRIARNEF